jgi:hypothetical protein
VSRPPEHSASVFINCPFDDEYDPTFKAIVSTIFDCGFVPRCALENDDGSEIRISKIFNLVASCKYSVHDLSRTELDRATRLPRFNMPLELGVCLGAKRFGPARQKQTMALILDRDRYRYHKFISDIAGQDIHAHDGKAEKAVAVVRDWLSDSSKRRTIPGGGYIWRRYRAFREDLPAMCRDLKREPIELTFKDYTSIVSNWLKANAG